MFSTPIGEENEGYALGLKIAEGVGSSGDRIVMSDENTVYADRALVIGIEEQDHVL